ncbi:MAG: hypothetical protein EOP09_00690 [Proteobacteria bacterium]|nr:MAG: hypothetical protein EOP09_00690 [Pseudomonadota bacterium]
MSDIASIPSASATESTSTGSESSWDNESSESEEDADLFPDVREARAAERKAAAEKKKDEPKEPKEPRAKADDKPAEPKAPKKFHKAVVNGREESVDEETLIREYQKARAGDERLAQATAKERQLQQFMTQLRENPAAILSDPRLGVDRQALAEAILRDQIEEELTDPKDREAKTLKEKLKAYEEREENEKRTAKEQAEKAERAEAVSKAHARLNDTFSKAMEQSVLSKNPDTAAATLRDMALFYRAARQQGHDVTPDEIAAHVERKHLTGFHSAANTLSGEELVSFLGADVVKKIRAHDLGQLEARIGKPTTQVNDNWAPRGEKTKEPTFIDPKELRDRIRGGY